MASDSKIHINVIFEKQTVTFNTKREKPFLKMFEAFAERMNMESSEFLKTALLYEETDYPSASLRFYLNEARIRPEQTPAELEMDDGDDIDATLMQQGGYFSSRPLCSSW